MPATVNIDPLTVGVELNIIYVKIVSTRCKETEMASSENSYVFNSDITAKL